MEESDNNNERDRLWESLSELVKLKDGPRDSDYERRKPLAWAAARRVLASIPPPKRNSP